MIDKATALDTVFKRLKALEPGHCIDVRTYKRNRGVAIRRLEQDLFEVRESGYNDERFEVELKKMKKLLKTLFKREFPRSTKLRLYNLGPCDTLEAADMGRKKL